MEAQSGDESFRGGRSVAGPLMNQPSPHVSPLPLGGFLVVFIALTIGFLAGSLAGLGFTALVSGILSASVAYAAYGHQTQIAIVRSLYFAGFFVILGCLIVLTTGIPWLAALAMALIAFAGSLLSATPPLGLSAALLSSTGYLLLAGFAVLFMKDQGVNIPLMLFALGIGAISGIALTALLSFALSRSPQRSTPAAAQTISLHSIWTNAWQAVRELRRAPRDGLRRALALGVAMFIFQSIPAHDGYLLLITTAIVLPVYGRVALLTVGSRLLGAFMAIGIALIVPFLLPRTLVTVIAILVIAYAIGTALRSTTNSLAATCIAFLLLIGAPGAEIGIYAGWRLIDAAGGFIIAWLFGYVLWPKQALMITPIPASLHHECESVRLVLNERS